MLTLAKAMPIGNAARMLGELDTRLWRIVEHYVWRAVEKLDLAEVRRIAADETSARRGRDYISLFVDMARRKVVYVADGKDAAMVKDFADFLEAHGGRREAVTDASIDMGAAFEAGIKENFPNAEITFDKFHVIELANEAVDQVRREEGRNNSRSRAGAGGKGGAVSLGSAEPGHDPSDADPHEPATAVHDERQIGSTLPRPLERLGRVEADGGCA
jgi:transposase